MVPSWAASISNVEIDSEEGKIFCASSLHKIVLVDVDHWKTCNKRSIITLG